MLIMPTEQAKVGMILAAPVAHPQHPEQDLLKRGYVLEETVLRRLHELGIDFIYIDYPGLDDLDKHLAANLSPQRQKIYQQIKETVVAAQNRTRPAVSYTDYYASTRELIITLLSHGQHPLYLESMCRMGDQAVVHATAVAHLSLLLGLRLEAYLIQQRSRLPAKHAREVVNLGVAGMLHDMGKLTLPQSLQDFTGVQPPENARDLAQWQEHAMQGYELIRRGVEPSAAAAVAHHHQHWDGSGFPLLPARDGANAALTREDIHVFARILSVADLHDRLSGPSPQQPRRTTLEVLHMMRTRYASWCDPVIFKTLESVAPPFPPGATVRLSDGDRAVVIDVDGREPYRPIVKRIVGSDFELSQQRLDLRQPDAPTITHLGKIEVEPFVPSQTRSQICAAV